MHSSLEVEFWLLKCVSKYVDFLDDVVQFAVDSVFGSEWLELLWGCYVSSMKWFEEAVNQCVWHYYKEELFPYS